MENKHGEFSSRSLPSFFVAFKRILLRLLGGTERTTHAKIPLDDGPRDVRGEEVVSAGELGEDIEEQGEGGELNAFSRIHRSRSVATKEKKVELTEKERWKTRLRTWSRCTSWLGELDSRQGEEGEEKGRNRGGMWLGARR